MGKKLPEVSSYIFIWKNYHFFFQFWGKITKEEFYLAPIFPPGNFSESLSKKFCNAPQSIPPPKASLSSIISLEKSHAQELAKFAYSKSTNFYFFLNLTRKIIRLLRDTILKHKNLI